MKPVFQFLCVLFLITSCKKEKAIDYYYRLVYCGTFNYQVIKIRSELNSPGWIHFPADTNTYVGEIVPFDTNKIEISFYVSHLFVAGDSILRHRPEITRYGNLDDVRYDLIINQFKFVGTDSLYLEYRDRFGMMGGYFDFFVTASRVK